MALEARSRAACLQATGLRATSVPFSDAFCASIGNCGSCPRRVGSHPSPGIMGSHCVFLPAFPRSVVLDMTGMRLMPGCCIQVSVALPDSYVAASSIHRS